eukprot:2132053-Pyramimonas_sp.AAC.1
MSVSTKCPRHPTDVLREHLLLMNRQSQMWLDCPGCFATPPLAHCRGRSAGCHFAFDVAAQPP